ncbi:MAG: hypothetical protein JXN64_12585 [Spirochaetes bacterium]|nr:hypothetical protein [Spirochaetota bacterium]
MLWKILHKRHSKNSVKWLLRKYWLTSANRRSICYYVKTE